MTAATMDDEVVATIESRQPRILGAASGRQTVDFVIALSPQRLSATAPAEGRKRTLAAQGGNRDTRQNAPWPIGGRHVPVSPPS
jgi:hypothetical protein